MATYRIQWKPSALKELKKLNRRDVPKIVLAVENLSREPHPDNCRKYLGTNHTYRIRVGNYRVIYSVFRDILTIDVIKVGHRKDIYKRK